MAILTCENASFSYDGRTVLEGVDSRAAFAQGARVRKDHARRRSQAQRDRLSAAADRDPARFPGQRAGGRAVGLPQLARGKTVLQRRGQAPRAGKPRAHGHRGHSGRRVSGALRRPAAARAARPRPVRDEEAAAARRACDGARPGGGGGDVQSHQARQPLRQHLRHHGHARRYATHILHLGHRQLFFGTAAEYRRSAIGRRFLGGGAI